MSKQHPTGQFHNKTPFNNEPINLTTPKNNKRFKPCHIRHKFTYGPVNTFQFQKRRTYYKSLTLDGSTYQYYRGVILKPLQIIKNMRHYNSISINNVFYLQDKCLDDVCSLLRRLNKIKSLNLKIGDIYIWNTKAALDRIHSIISSARQNIESLNIRLSFGYDPKHILERFTLMTMKHFYSSCKVRGLSLVFEDEAFFSNLMKFNSQGVPLNPSSATSILQHRFQRIRSISNLQLLFFTANTEVLTIYTHSFSHLQNLQNLEVVSPSSSYFEGLLRDLMNIQPLRSLVLHYQVELEGLMRYLRSPKAPETFAIRGGWFYNSALDYDFFTVHSPEDMSISTKRLHLDFKYLLRSTEQVKFLTGFIDSFSHLEDLKVFLVADEEHSGIDILGATLNRLTGLRRLTLGLSVIPLDGQIHKFFSYLQNILSLETFSLVMKVPNITDEAWRDLQTFLLQNKSLKTLELYWKYFNVTCLNNLKKVWAEMFEMKLIRLCYMTDNEDHGEIHEKVISKLQHSLHNISSAETVEVSTSCSYRTLINCEMLGHRLAVKTGKNKGIRHFYFQNESEIKTPFYNDSLFH